MRVKARPVRRRRSQRNAAADATRNNTRYLVTSFQDGREVVEVKTPDRKRAQRVAKATASAGVIAVLHEHVTHLGWQQVRRFDPTGGAA